ncbi:MAG: HD domain-containing protein, partial [Proteobacteria bacterium]|nr:HD domain-containing protein [Pseudomonadota bacterium]
DIGKVGVPDAILLKPGRLTDAEWEEMKRHTWYGHEALQVALDGMGPNSFLALAQEIAHTHHERWDGRGYPQGLAGEAIPPSGRLMALADVYDALISRRVYKEPWPHPDSRREIAAGSGTQFDPRVVEAFLAREEDFVAIARRYRDSN